MNDYIKTWHAEHATILAALKEIPTLGLESEDGQARVRELERSLLAHLKSENENLYPVLNKAALSDPELKQKLDLFARGMEKITAQALAFFARMKRAPHAPDIAVSFELIAVLLRNRISSEESVLIQEYIKLVC
jgi:hypothetical protein